MSTLASWGTSNALEGIAASSSAGLGQNISFISAYDVSKMKTGGNGTVGNPWTGWEATLNALPTSAMIWFPAGYYTLATMITVKDKWNVMGAGREVTFVTSATTGTSFRLGSSLSSPIGNGVFGGMTITNTNAANTGSGILVVSWWQAAIRDVKVIGHRYGKTFINAQSVGSYDFTTEYQTRAGLWIVGNGDYNLTNADLDYSAYAGSGTNVLSFYNGQVNEGTTAYGLLDDGYVAHSFFGVNFNGGLNAIRCAGARQINIIGSDFEGQAGDIVTSSNNTLAGNGVGGNGGILFSGCSFSPNYPTGKYAIDAASFERLSLVNCQFQTPATAIRNAGGVNIFNMGSEVNNGALYDATPASYFDYGSNNAAITLATSQPIITGAYISSAAQRVSNAATATGPVGTVVKKLAIYDAAGVLLGYMPIYNSIT